jgi:hypothetical protein
MIFFMHVPKSGGTTIKKLLEDLAKKRGGKYYDYSLFKPQSHLERIRDNLSDNDVVAGHFPYGLDKYLGVKGDWATILRNPIDRFKSRINQVCTQRMRFRHFRIARQIMHEEGIKSFVNSRGFRIFIAKNNLTAYLNGKEFLYHPIDSYRDVALDNLMNFQHVILLDDLKTGVDEMFDSYEVDTPNTIPHCNKASYRVKFDFDVAEVVEADLEVYNRYLETL